MPFKHWSLLSTALVATAKIKSVDFPSKNFNFSIYPFSIDSNLSWTDLWTGRLVFAFALLHLYIHHLRRIVQGKLGSTTPEIQHASPENGTLKKRRSLFGKYHHFVQVPFVQLWGCKASSFLNSQACGQCSRSHCTCRKYSSASWVVCIWTTCMMLWSGQKRCHCSGFWSGSPLLNHI